MARLPWMAGSFQWVLLALYCLVTPSSSAEIAAAASSNAVVSTSSSGKTLAAASAPSMQHSASKLAAAPAPAPSAAAAVAALSPTELWTAAVTVACEKELKHYDDLLEETTDHKKHIEKTLGKLLRAQFEGAAPSGREGDKEDRVFGGLTKDHVRATMAALRFMQAALDKIWRQIVSGSKEELELAHAQKTFYWQLAKRLDVPCGEKRITLVMKRFIALTETIKLAARTMSDLTKLRSSRQAHAVSAVEFADYILTVLPGPDAFEAEGLHVDNALGKLADQGKSFDAGAAADMVINLVLSDFILKINQLVEDIELLQDIPVQEMLQRAARRRYTVLPNPLGRLLKDTPKRIGQDPDVAWADKDPHRLYDLVGTRQTPSDKKPNKPELVLPRH